MMPVVLTTNLVNGILIVAVSLNTVSPTLLTAWSVLMLVVIIARAAAWVMYRRQGGSGERWARIAVLGSGAAGVLWGTAGAFFFIPDDATHLMVLGFILGGMGAGAVTALSPYLPAFYLYLLPSVLPFCLRLISAGDTDHLAMAAACALYLVALVVLARRVHQWLSISVLLRFENTDLVETLERRVEQRTAELQEANDELYRDIAERQRIETILANYGGRQAAVAEFGQTALSGIDLDTLFAKAAALARDGLQVARVAIFERAVDSRELLLRSAAGWIAGSAPGASPVTSPDAALADHAQLSLAPVDRGDARQATPPAAPDGLAGAVNAISVAILGKQQPFGELAATDTAPRVFSAYDVSFLQSIANMLAAAIDRKRTEDDIQQLALVDPLTGLPNRTLFRDHLLQRLAMSKRNRSIFAVLLLDLDNFKDVNDTLGHPIGDRLLKAVAERLRTCIRETDSPARLGGDEFALILSDLRSREDAGSVAAKLVGRISEPFVVEGHEIRVGVSVGITICPTDARDPDEALQNADLALYRAKTEGRNTHKFYSGDMTAQIGARKAVERDLRRAFDGKQLCLYYQPQYGLADYCLATAEALLRWRHPTRGLLLPDEFIPVAEASGLIVPLGAWVLERACEQQFAWREQGLPPIVIAVNLSLSQCRRGELVATLEAIASRRRCDLTWLELEVTEQLFLPPEVEGCVDTLRSLMRLGVTVSIDDFGTGYSSLGRLQSLPVNKVKIDKCFVSGLGRDRDAEMIVRAIIALARSLGMAVAAEGVESEEQLAFLRAEGCDAAQGFHLGAPMPPHQFATLFGGNIRNVTQ